MRTKRTLLRLGLLLAAGTFCGSCSPNPKKKCNTCPKWTSDIQDINTHNPSIYMSWLG